MNTFFGKGPNELKTYVDKVVKLETKDGIIHEGSVYTIDPVSKCVVLLSENEFTSQDIIFNHAIKTIISVGDFKPINLVDCAGLPEILNCNKRKMKLKEWLNQNLIPVEESGEMLQIAGQVTIMPPYKTNNCFSSNERVLLKIQDLIDSLPSED